MFSSEGQTDMLEGTNLQLATCFPGASGSFPAAPHHFRKSKIISHLFAVFTFQKWLGT